MNSSRLSADVSASARVPLLRGLFRITQCFATLTTRPGPRPRSFTGVLPAELPVRPQTLFAVSERRCSRPTPAPGPTCRFYPVRIVRDRICCASWIRLSHPLDRTSHSLRRLPSGCGSANGAKPGQISGPTDGKSAQRMVSRRQRMVSPFLASGAGPAEFGLASARPPGRRPEAVGAPPASAGIGRRAACGHQQPHVEFDQNEQIDRIECSGGDGVAATARNEPVQMRPTCRARTMPRSSTSSAPCETAAGCPLIHGRD